jgi:hypothetical protein
MGLARDVLAPFVSPRATMRRPASGRNSTYPEKDRMVIELEAGDWMKLCALAGRLDAEMLEAMPWLARPSVEFIAEIDRIATAARRLGL